MSCSKITIGASGLVTLENLTDNSNGGAYVNNATATGTLYDATRTTSLATFTLAYVSGTNGNYQGTISATDTGTLTAGTAYKVKVVATVGSTVKPFWLDCVADY